MTADFLPKPVDLARESDFDLGPLRVRPSLRQVESQETPETLEPRVMQVLVALAQRRGEVVSRDELVQRCWAGRAVGEDAISRAIARVRKVGEASQAFTLETISRVGYRLVATGVDAPPVMADAIPDAPVETPIAASGRRIRRIFLAFGVLFVAFLAGLGLWAMLNRDHFAPTKAPRIAVLPFEVISGGADAEMIARAAQPAIVDALVNAGQEVVRSRDTADKSVSYIVDGDIAMKDGKLLLTTRISDGKGVSIWTRPIEQGGAGADLPSQAGAAVAYAFRWLTVSPTVIDAPPAGQAATLRGADSLSGTQFLAAYEERKRLADNAPDNAMTRIAVVITGSAAIAEAALADRPAMLAEMREWTRRAREMEPDNSILQLAEAAIVPEIDWARREAAFRKGVDGLPRTGIIAGNYSNFLLLAGRAKEAEALARKHMAIEPLSPLGSTYLAMALTAQGRFDEAAAETARLRQLFPDHASVLQARFAALLWSGDFAGAEALLAEPHARDVIDPPAEVRPAGLLLKAMQTRSAADIEALAQACSDTRRLKGMGAGLCIAGIGELGQLNDVFAMLDQLLPDLRGATAAERDARWLEHPVAINVSGKVLMGPRAARVRADARFIDVAERIGLIEFWRTSGAWPDFCASEPKSVCAQMKARK